MIADDFGNEMTRKPATDDGIVARLVKVRDFLEQYDDLKGRVEIMMRAAFYVHTGDTEITFTVSKGYGETSVTGNHLDSVVTEFLRQENIKKTMKPICLPRVK